MIYGKHIQQRFSIVVLLLLMAGGATATWFVVSTLRQNASNLGGNAVSSQKSCGVQALFIALARLGIPERMKSLEKELKPDSEGLDFGQLLWVAKHRGCEATLAQLDWDQLMAWDGTAVLWVKGNHFIAVDPRWRRDSENIADNLLRVFDSGVPGQWWFREQVESVWHGEAMLLKRSADGLAPTGQEPRITWNECLFDTGYIEAGKTYSYTIGFRNVGGADLNIRVGAVGCGCAKAELSSSTIPPGEAGTLVVKLHTGGKRGFYTTQVLMETNDPTCSHVPIYVRYGVETTEVTSADTLYFGDLPRGGEATSHFVIYDSGRMKLQVDGADVEVVERVEGIRGVYTGVTVTRIEPDTDVPQTPQKLPVKVGDYLVGVRLCATTDAALGPLAGRVTAVTAQGKRIFVKFEGNVVSGIRTEPCALALTANAGSLTEVALTITPRAGQSIETVKGRMEGDSAPRLVLLEQNRSSNPARIKVRIGVPELVQRSSLFGSLVLDCGAGDIVRVPVVLNVTR